MSKRVAVIGAGASGLPAIKCCLDEGLEPVCFERTDHIGGLWYYTDDIQEGQGCVMKSTILNTSKESMCYSDFPVPKEYPNFMHNSQVVEYFSQYADHFGLKKYIRFNSSVNYLRRADDYEETGRWVLDIKEKSGKHTSECFDAVLVCTGHYSEKKMPHFPGMENFQGKIIHSLDYKKPTGLDDKRVVVVGLANSAVDIAFEASTRTKQVFLSTRRGAWVINRVFDNGIPIDLSFSRLTQAVFSFLPTSMVNKYWEKKCDAVIDHEKYGLKPAHLFINQQPTAGDLMGWKVCSGAIVIKPNIRRFTTTGVQFDDGTLEDDIDYVFMATGYNFGFSFIEKSVIDVKNNKVELYKYMYPPDLKHNSLAFIGCVQPIGAFMPTAELQSRLATMVIQGKKKLPDRTEMWKDIHAKNDALARRFYETSRYTILTDRRPFQDELADLIGCKPNIGRLLLQDPWLGLSMLLSPDLPCQYRLMGPGAWQGARQTSMTLWDRVYYPLRTRRPVPVTTQKFFSYEGSLIGFFVIVMVSFWCLLLI